MTTTQSALSLSFDSAISVEQINTYFLDLEGLLERVERATTHYQTLAVERTANHKQIKQSYEEMINLLYPPYAISENLPEGMLLRIDRCFNKSSLAFSVLASFGRRKDYDNALVLLAGKAAQDGPKTARPFESRKVEPAPAPKPTDEQISITRLPAQKEVFSEFASPSNGANRRRAERFKVSIPVRVAGFDRKSGKWQEMAETIDVSRTGTNIRLRRNVRHGAVLYLTLPLPQKLRGHGFAEATYKVYALVRRVEPQKKGVRVVGLEYLGEHPPAGFIEKPWAVFRTKRWGGNERRRAPRHDRSELVRIEYLTESMQLIILEEARTENISRTGLRIAVKAAPPEFDLIRVTCPRRHIECLATVRNRYIAKDGLERLCIQLLDKQWQL